MIALAASAAGAQEQPQCATRADMIEHLAQKYGERQVGIGVINQRSIVEIFANPASGNWTVVATGAGGMSCVLTEGTGWINARLRTDPPQGEPS